MMTLHEALRHGRTKANYTQQAVADSIGVDVTTYAHYETGRREPNSNQLEILSLIMEIPAELIPPAKLPIHRTTIYPKPLLDDLENAITQYGHTTDNSHYLRHRLNILDNALQPIMAIRSKTLSTKGLEFDLPTGTTFLNVNLDRRAENLISLCHRKQSELVEFWLQNAKV